MSYGYAPHEDPTDEDEDELAVALRVPALATDLLDFGNGGWLHVFGEASRLVLVDGAYAAEREVRSQVNGKESVPEDASFTKYVASAPTKRAARLHTIDVTSGWLLLMSATASFAKLQPKKGLSLSRLEKVDANCLQVDDHLGGHALLLRMPKGHDDLVGEPERGGKWGSAERVLDTPLLEAADPDPDGQVEVSTRRTEDSARLIERVLPSPTHIAATRPDRGLDLRERGALSLQTPMSLPFGFTAETKRALCVTSPVVGRSQYHSADKSARRPRGLTGI